MGISKQQAGGSGGGTIPTLQQVTDNGHETTNELNIGFSLSVSTGGFKQTIQVNESVRNNDDIYSLPNNKGVDTFAMLSDIGGVAGLIDTTTGNNTSNPIVFIDGGALFSDENANNFFGSNTGSGNTGAGVNAIGGDSATNNTGVAISAIGNQSAQGNTGDQVNAIGNGAAVSNSGSYVNAMGTDSGAANTFSYVNLFGRAAKADGNYQTVWSKDTDIVGEKNLRHDFSAMTVDQKVIWRNASGTVPLIVATPSTASSAGVAGSIAYDTTHFYVCIATNTWVRSTLATW